MADPESAGEKRRHIRSYVLRQGRLTRGQQRSLDSEWDRFGLDSTDGDLDLGFVFGRSAPVVAEVGFGMGESLYQQATETPEKNFIGIEVHRPGVGHLLNLASEGQLDNLRVFNEDCLDVFERAIPWASLETVQLFFPDPWPKKRHHKRRIVNNEFLSLVKRCLVPGGLLHIATDWVPYAEAVRELFATQEDFLPVKAPARPLTKFENRGVNLGHEINDLAYRTVDLATGSDQ